MKRGCLPVLRCGACRYQPEAVCACTGCKGVATICSRHALEAALACCSGVAAIINLKAGVADGAISSGNGSEGV